MIQGGLRPGGLTLALAPRMPVTTVDVVNRGSKRDGIDKENIQIYRV